MAGFRSRLPILAAPLVGVGLYGAMRFSPTVSQGKILVLWGIGVVTVAAVAAAGFFLMRTASAADPGRQAAAADGQAGVAPSHGIAGAPRLTEPPILLTTGAFLFLLIAGSSFGRCALTILTMLLIAVYFEGLRRVADRDNPVSPADLAQLAHMLDLAAVFLMSAFVFGIRAFYDVPALILAIVIAAIWAFVAAENLSRTGIPVKMSAGPLVAVAVFGAEAYATLSLLPISHLVAAAVSVILLAVSTLIVGQTLSGAVEPAKIRRDLAASIGLAALLLLTARWI
jgi:hypothetical protein